MTPRRGVTRTKDGSEPVELILCQVVVLDQPEDSGLPERRLVRVLDATTNVVEMIESTICTTLAHR